MCVTKPKVPSILLSGSQNHLNSGILLLEFTSIYFTFPSAKSSKWTMKWTVILRGSCYIQTYTYTCVCIVKQYILPYTFILTYISYIWIYGEHFKDFTESFFVLSFNFTCQHTFWSTAIYVNILPIFFF